MPVEGALVPVGGVSKPIEFWWICFGVGLGLEDHGYSTGMARMIVALSRDGLNFVVAMPPRNGLMIVIFLGYDDHCQCNLLGRRGYHHPGKLHSNLRGVSHPGKMFPDLWI